ncbi:MAG: glycosyltransferase family 4 protein [Thermodesulfovibrionales bacterium]
MRVLIACPTLAENDAIGNDILEQCRCLREEGIEASIFAENSPPVFRDIVTRDARRVLDDKKTVLIYHHGIHWEQGTELFRLAKGKKVVKYHNITPEHFFLPYSFDFFQTCLLGRRQNSELMRTGIDLLLADSNYNGDDFRDIGFPEDRIRVLAPFHRMTDYDRLVPDAAIFEKSAAGLPVVFFVGRIAPNKGHRHFIRTAYYYRMLFGEDVRFVIAGGFHPSLMGYSGEVCALVRQLRLENMVSFAGKVTVEALKAFYQKSAVFLLLSEHEGFCVPILESQYFNLPIVAFGCCAVGETLGDNQLVFDRIDYQTIAAAVHTVVNDREASTFLAVNGQRNFQRFERERLKKEFLGIIRELT